jgi:hypothetical protein
MTGQSLLGWWNLVYIVPFLLALLYLLLYTMSGVTFGEAEADGDCASDADHDVDAGDVHVHADVGEAGHDHDSHVHHHHAPFYTAALSWLGVGKVPLSLLLMVLMLTWGAIGLLVNQLMIPHVAQESMVAFYSLPAALLISLVATRTLVRLMARYAPLNESYAQRRHALLGLTGDAVYSVDDASGVCVVRDAYGTLHQIACRVEFGPAIDKGTKVKLVGFNVEKSVFYVIPDPDSVTGAPAKQSEVAS